VWGVSGGGRELVVTTARPKRRVCLLVAARHRGVDGAGPLVAGLPPLVVLVQAPFVALGPDRVGLDAAVLLQVIGGGTARSDRGAAAGARARSRGPGAHAAGAAVGALARGLADHAHGHEMAHEVRGHDLVAAHDGLGVEQGGDLGERADLRPAHHVGGDRLGHRLTLEAHAVRLPGVRVVAQDLLVHVELGAQLLVAALLGAFAHEQGQGLALGVLHHDGAGVGQGRGRGAHGGRGGHAAAGRGGRGRGGRCHRRGRSRGQAAGGRGAARGTHGTRRGVGLVALGLLGLGRASCDQREAGQDADQGHRVLLHVVLLFLGCWVSAIL